ncbi:MAG: phytanoyl-CoA dioxygenase family protein, partial [Pyrinomonadaceae bacterium]
LQHLTDEQVRSYKDEGYLLIPDLVSQKSAAALRREVLDIMRVIGEETSKLRQSNQYLKGSGLDALINSPHLRAITERLMGGLSSVYLPFTAVKSTGGGRFHFHQDNQYTRFDGPGINLWVALQEINLENGCLQVVPRSHLQGTLEAVESGDDDTHKKITWEPSDFVPIKMQPGDGIAFSRLTVHGSGPNTTSEPRVGYAIQFHHNNVRALIDGEWRLLVEHPRWSTAPVREIVAPRGNEMLDGH